MVDSLHDIIKKVSPHYKDKEPDFQTRLIYQSSSETLEPVYFWLLDFMQEDLGLDTEKIYDNFESSPGSGHFSEQGQKATAMQQQASKVMADIGVMTKSLLNIIYDLKEFRTRLKTYEDYNSNDQDKKQAAKLSLKQIWLDKVDIQKGNSSVKAMALGQAGFGTLLNAFLAVEDETLKDKKGNEIDLNEIVKRILRPRIQEFNNWISESEKELKKRYSIEKNFLKSQVDTLKLYSRWAKPYLKASEELKRKDFGNSGRGAALVKAFNTVLLEMTLLGKSKIKVESAAKKGDIPPQFANTKILKSIRNYNSVVVVDLFFRGIPQKAGQHYVFGGRAEVTFSAYSLNDEELMKIHQELEKSDVNEALKLAENITDETLKEIQEDLEFFLQDKEKEEEENKQEKNKSGTNPLLALFGVYNKKENKKSIEKNKEVKEVKKDNWQEKNYIRPLAGDNASTTAFNIFNVYKKAHGMANFDPSSI